MTTATPSALETLRGKINDQIEHILDLGDKVYLSTFRVEQLAPPLTLLDLELLEDLLIASYHGRTSATGLSVAYQVQRNDYCILTIKVDVLSTLPR